mgnify:CR=1 FL=1
MAGKLEATRRPQGPSEEEIYSLAHRDLLRGTAESPWLTAARLGTGRQQGDGPEAGRSAPQGVEGEAAQQEGEGG